MITRQDIEALRDAYRDTDGAAEPLKFELERRETFRANLHASHARVLDAEVDHIEKKFRVEQLERKVGVGK